MKQELLKVLIVDDEKLVKTMIEHCIDWEEAGYQIIGSCESASSALDVMEEREPDIILTDICMPVIDGLQFSRMVKKINPGIKVIILTGHDDFDYAKEGIDIGILAYLLKPIDSEEVLETLTKARKQILEERRQEKEFSRLREQIEQQNHVMRERCLNALWNGGEAGEIKEQLHLLGMDFNSDFFQVAIVGIFQESKGSVQTAGDRLLYRMRVYEILKDYVKNENDLYVIQGNMQESIILNYNREDIFTEMCEQMLKMLSQMLQCNVYIGMGNSYNSFEKIRESYQEASDALQLYYMKKQSEVICFKNLSGVHPSDGGVDNEAIHKFAFFMKSGMISQAKELVDQMFVSIKENGGEKTQIIICSMRILLEIETVLVELDLSSQKVTEGDNLIKNLFCFESMGETRDYLNMVMDAASRKILAVLKAREKNLITKVCDYIQAHFMEEELSLSQIAQEMYTNVSYLSRLFKEKTGQTFRNYMFELRMKKAAELLKDTDNKGYEVAELVGIKDPHYFSVCFKKYTGMSVSEYKKAILI